MLKFYQNGRKEPFFKKCDGQILCILLKIRIRNSQTEIRMNSSKLGELSEEEAIAYNFGSDVWSKVPKNCNSLLHNMNLELTPSCVLYHDHETQIQIFKYHTTNFQESHFLLKHD
jgi:hypothetical protein